MRDKPRLPDIGMMVRVYRCRTTAGPLKQFAGRYLVAERPREACVVVAGKHFDLRKPRFEPDDNAMSLVNLLLESVLRLVGKLA
jgi:hypothetical protein